MRPGHVYLAAGLRTPFVKAGGALSKIDAVTLSVPVVQSMMAQLQTGEPDLMIWGAVIPDLSLSNIGRELAMAAGLPRHLPALSTVLACSTSMIAAIEAAGMLGGDRHLALVGGVETMSRIPVGLTSDAALRIRQLAAENPMEAMDAFRSLGLSDITLKTAALNNRVSGRSMGEHTEDTARMYEIARAAQDALAFDSHRKTVAATDAGFFGPLIVPLCDVTGDTIPRRDSTLEKLATLTPVFDRTSGKGSLTAGNSSPLTDGAAGLWVADEVGLSRLPGSVTRARMLDWELAAVDFLVEGMLMAPSWAIPRLLARNGLTFGDIAIWEIHEAFAAQVLANVKAMENPEFRRSKVGINVDLGEFPWQRLNPNGGSLAIGHPFAATGARILSQTVHELGGHPPGSRAVVSICADGGQGSVVLLEAI
jgi:acetyl-CoA acetyltransferase family protein